MVGGAGGVVGAVWLSCAHPWGVVGVAVRGQRAVRPG